MIKQLHRRKKNHPCFHWFLLRKKDIFVNSEMKEMGKTRTIENKCSHEKSSTFQEYFHSTLNEIEASETDL